VTKRLLFGILAALVVLPTQAAHTRARMFLEMESARAGDTVMAGILLQMEPGWHTYWVNPGSFGMPTRIEWQLPKGVSAGQIQWPAPEKLLESEGPSYIYKDQVVLLVPLRLATNIAAGSIKLGAQVAWLECETSCIPGKAGLGTTLVVGPETKPSKDAALLQAWVGRIPAKAEDISLHTRWEKATVGSLRPLLLEWNTPRQSGEADFFPFQDKNYEVQGATDRVPAEPGKIALRKQVKKLSGDWPKRISGLVVQGTGTERIAWEVEAPIDSGGTAASIPALPLWQLLLFAFLGGLILNIMPCVLPVIALKVLSFVSQAGGTPSAARKLGLVYGLGVLASFAALALMIIALKAGGHQAAWGMQFGNPVFLVCLTTLVTLVSLNLFGAFEVNPGGAVTGAAGAVAARHGAAGAFANGVLATVLATPCTAPFLGTAFGFALTQRPGIIFATLLTAGAGLAAPYVILAMQPGWLKFLPRPGPWMERFKVLLGFPMLATAVWLFSLLPAHYGTGTVWVGVFLVVVAMAAWMYGEFVQRGRNRRGLGALLALIVLAGGYVFIMEEQLEWRSAAKREPIAWEPWSPAAVAQARAANRPVLVDFTADWCLTCQANKRIALDDPAVRAKLKETRTVALLADYTKAPAEMTEELNRFGRAGVPLVLVYPSQPEAPPLVLPVVLTPSIVLDSLEQATKTEPGS
jgi:thiol:disulfide interchange protein